jgi:hypothetical protein
MKAIGEKLALFKIIPRVAHEMPSGLDFWRMVEGRFDLICFSKPTYQY